MRRTVLSGLMAILAVATVAVASAASLDVRPASLTTASAAHPCEGAAEVTTPGAGTTFSSVAVSAPAACAGRTVQVAVGDGGAVRQGSASLASDGRATVDLDGSYTSSTAVTVAAVVDGWHLDGVWSYDAPTTPSGPIVAGNDETVIESIEWTIWNDNQVCAAVRVTTSTPDPSRWLVHLNVGERPYNGAQSGYGITGGHVEFTPSATAVNGIVGIQGEVLDWQEWAKLSEKTTREFTVCHYGTPAPANVPSAYDVTVTRGEWGDAKACLVTTITGNGSSMFYVGWEAQLDMTPAFERIESSGRAVGAVRPDTWGNIFFHSPALSPAVRQYTLTSDWQGVVRLSESLSVTVCALDN